MKKGYCSKCGKYNYIHDHHILPVSTFGKNKHTMNLCVSCHTDYHEQLGTQNLKNPSIEFHFEKFFRWLMGLSICVLLLYMLFN